MPTKPPVHRPPGWKPPSRDPNAPDPYYKSKAHLRWRAAVLKRDGYTCTDPRCPTPNYGRGGRLIADHIVSRRDGGSDTDVNNGQTLCPACDNRKHRAKGLK
jgi:5-methylcytosine-specific restriction endonuclease McrA